MEKLKTMSIKQKLIILFSLLTLVLVGMILLVPRNSRFSIAKLANNFNADGEEITAFVITVKDANDNSIVLSNSRFIIKELTIVDDVEYESDPVDVYGNVLGTEEVVNGETVRVFETDSNGVIEANFRDGNYKIEQVEAKEGYKVANVQYFGVNAERGSNVELVSEEPLYTGNTDANSSPDSFCVEGRTDGSALYYNVGYLSYVDSTNQVVWTEYSDLVYEIIARDDGFDVLTDSQIVQYDNSGNITNTIEVAYGMRSFKKDANGNFVITGTFYGSLSIDSSLTTSGSSITLSSTSYTDDMYVLTLDSNNLVSSAYSIEGDYSEVPRTLAITTDGNYVISYVVDTYEYNIVKVNSLTGATIATVETDISGRSYDLVHYVAAGSDGSVYYGGNYSGTLSYAASETANGTAITLTSNDEDGVVIKYDSNMKILWAINLGGAGGDHFFKADTTEDGGFVMGGDSDTGAITIAAENSQSGYSITSTPDSENVGTWRGITVKVNSDGKAVWAKEFGFSSNEGMYAITTFTNDSFALCGFETANSTRNAVLIRVNEEVIEEEIEAMTSLDIYNEPIICNITTEVTGEGGTISGQDDTVYETVNWGADATKEMVVTANTGYIIKSITIEKTDDAGTVTTENVTLDADTKTYTITPLTNLNGNIHVIAEFEKIEAKVIVHHYITGTTTQVPASSGGTVADEEYTGTVGEEYTTTDTSDINTRYYELAETPDNATGTYIEGTIEVIYYYNPVEYTYTIYYYYDGTEDTSKRESLKAGYNTQVTEYPDKAGIGYKLDSTTNVPLTIGTSTWNNRMRIYYVTDEDQRKDLTYTVEYYKDGNIVSADTQTVTENVQVLEADTLTVDKTTINTTDKYEGYTLESTSPTTIPDTINSGETIKVYYVKRTDLSYTVNYYEEGTTTKVATSKVVNNQTFDNQVTENAIDVAGYNKVGDTESTITIKVSGNEINFYYAKRTDLSYTVKYLEQGTNAELASTKTVNNQTYKSTATESAIDIAGYDKVDPTTASITIEVSGNEIVFYYTKRTDLSYTVKYLEQGTNAELASTKTVNGQTYKSVVTENAIDIEGYDKVNPTTANITIEVTGNEIIFYYTKRTDLSYIVKYLEQGTNAELASTKTVNNQTYKSLVTENAIDVEGYNKVNTEESIVIEVENNVINFYYTKRVDLSYTVKYLEKDTDAELASAKVVDGQTFKSTVTEEAIDITGYDKVAPTTASITIEVSGNEIVFCYTKRTDLSYTVKYLEQGTNAELASAKVVDGQTFKSTVTEEAIDITGYDKVDPTTVSITIEVSGSEIVFYYTKRTDLSYTVKYLEKDTDAELTSAKVVDGQTFKSTVTEEAIDITGYDKANPTTANITIEVTGNEIIFYYTKRTDLSYTVKYLEQDTNRELATEKVVNSQTYKSEVTEQAIDIEGYTKVNPEETITIEVSGNEIIFYYKKVEGLSYTVNYYEEGTTTSVATSKTVDGKIFEDIVTEAAIDVDGYNKVNPTEQTITIGVGENIINFYYEKRTDLSYTVKYLEKETYAVLSAEKVVDGQTFKSIVTENAIEITGYDKVDPIEQTITIEVTGNEIVFYYTKRVDLSYTVKYLEKDTDVELAVEKVVDGQTFKLEVTEQAIDIEGYTKVNSEETITIEVSGNEIIFYYKKVEGLSYTVNYYEKGTTTSVATSKVVDGKTFEEEVTENAIDVEGYDKVVPTEQTITIGVGENIINFYYEKRTDLSYTVKYLEKETYAVLSAEKVVDGQTFKSIVTENAIEISGYDKTNTEETITIEVTGNEIVFYYTKRVDLSYTVKYLEKDTDVELAVEKVVNGQTYKSIVTEEAIEISGYDKTNLEKSITIEVTGNEIIFYYKKVEGLSYTVNYLEEGTQTKVAPSKTVDGKTFEDKVTESAIDVEGYDKVDPTESSIVIGVGENVINFYYTKRTDLSYTVKYLEQDTNIELLTEKVVDGQTFKSTATENSVDISGYDKVNPTEQTITIEVSGNEIIFYYTKRVDLSYTVRYLEEGTDAVLSTEKVVDGQTFKSTVTEKAIEITGYDKVNPAEQTITIEVSGNEIVFYYTKRVDLSYTVKYLEKDTDAVLATEKVVDNQTFKSTVTESAIEISGYDKANPIEKSITIEVTGNEIVFYYTKRTDLSYTVKYLEQDTNKELATEKVVDGQEYKDVITEQAIDIEGYTKVNPEETITIEVTGNEIIFYYTKRVDLSYTVRYLEQGSNIELSLNKTVDGKTFQEQITESARDIEGYEKVGPTESTITMAVSGNEITFYYAKRTDLSYTVKYLEEDSNEVLLTEKVVNGRTFQETITEQSVDIAGYNKVNLKESIVMAVSGNEITFYYTKKSDIEYKVEFYYEGVLDSSKTETHQATFKEIIDSYTDNNEVGYKLDEEKNFPLQISANSEENVIQIYYVIDDEQTKEIKYTVEYYKEGTLIDIDTQVNTKTVQLLDSEVLTVNKDEINIVDKYFGYRLDTTEPTVIPDEVNNGDVIKVYYVIDEANTKTLSYTVEYYKEGVLVEEDTQTVSETVQILQPDTLDVRKGEINTVNKYVGYKLQETTPSEIPNKIATGETIKVYYVIDEKQRKDLSYTIEYYKDGELQKDETKEVSINVQLLEPDTIPVNKAEMVLSGKYVGYKLEKTSPAEIPAIANNGDVIRIYYIKDQFNYTVEYYYDGNIDSTKTDILTATYEDVIKEYTDKNIFGYRLEKTEGLPLKVSEKPEENIIKVYYIIDDGNTKTLNYTVEYYMDGVLQEGDTQLEYKIVQILQPDTFEVDKSKINLVDKYVGYKLEKTEPEGIPDVATTGDVYKVYYVKDTFGYRVEYYYEGQLVSEKTENLSALYESMIDVYPDKNNGKYYLDYTENFPMKVTEISSNNVIKVYYEKKLSTITVHYYWDGINNTNNKEVDDKKRTLGEEVDNGETKENGRVSVSQDVIIEDRVDTVHKIVAASDVADKYELISKPVSEEITMTVEPQEFEYIYRLKNAKVTVNFIEVGTGKILGTKIMEGQVDDRYHAVPDSISGFSLRNDKIPENEVGKMTLEPITVNFYYDANPQGVGITQTATPAEKTEYKGNGPATGDAEIIVCMAIVLAVLAINVSQGKILKVNTKEKVNGGKKTRKEKLVGKRHSSKEPSKVARVSRLERNCKKGATKRQRKH